MKNSSKALIVSIVVLVIFGGYFVSKSQFENSIPTQQEESSPLPVAVNTYKNLDWGVSFQYPSDLDSSNPGNWIVKIEEKENEVSLKAGVNWGMNFRRFENTAVNQRVTQITKSVLNDPEIQDLGIQKINGYNARSLIIKYDQGDNKIFLFQKGRDVIEVDSGLSVNGVDQILSTIAFE